MTFQPSLDIYLGSLPEILKTMLPQPYTYLIKNFNQLPSYQTVKTLRYLKLNWMHSLILMIKKKCTNGFQHSRHAPKQLCLRLKVLQLRESMLFLEKNGTAYIVMSIHLRLEKWRLELSHPIYDKFLNLFNDGHSPVSGLHSHEDDLHLSAENDQELLKLLVGMFDHLEAVVNEYNSSGNSKGALQKYDTYVGKITLEKALNLLKTILPPYAFYGRNPQIGPINFLTDNSDAERNALELCWPQAVRILCTFHFLQAFWRWLYDAKHENSLYIRYFRKLLFFLSLLRRHVEILWEHRNFWALSFRSGLLIHGNHTNNYIERSFERFYEQRLLVLRIDAPVAYNLLNDLYAHLGDGRYGLNQKNKHGAIGALCKHQAAIAMKFHIKMMNFLLSLTPDDRMVKSLKADLFMLHFTLQESESSNQKKEIAFTTNSVVETSDNSDNSTLDIFIEEVRTDYENPGSQFSMDATHIKSGAMIRVQVESVKRRKLEGSI
ncbi:361_t:CDS:10, partial [Gigaspora margarita]